jgi:hypothetical protein
MMKATAEMPKYRPNMGGISIANYHHMINLKALQEAENI